MCNKVTTEIVRMHSLRITFGEDDIPESSGIPARLSSPEQTEHLSGLTAKNNVCVWVSLLKNESHRIGPSSPHPAS